MSFLILGAGSLGGYYGGLLQKGGSDVTFLVRPKTANRLSKKGIRISLEDGYYNAPVKIVTADMIDTKFDVIFLTCKAYDLETAIKSIEPGVGNQSVILPILNGVNHIDILIDRFGSDYILPGVTQFLVNQDNDGTILPTLHGSGGQKTIFGEIKGGTSTRCDDILMAMKRSMPNASVSVDVLRECWIKLSGAGPSFAVASLLQARGGRVADTEIGARVVENIYEESAAVCSAEGYPPPEEMKNIILNNLWGQKGSNYGPSILADIENNRKTEGEQVIGDLVQRARKHNLRTPLLEAALCKIQLYENNLIIK